ncbi:hypothetical protein [Arcobacter sp. F2176]|uniref:hypothetical protein n=1 Tax=Arcobacter sp. F2176 TaxID=2044511 RepID=UPI00100AAA8B|nr:hypothetical protein [Arcobacter sp. F2176]RXJ82637.1 hypothetical protein CRU95_00810 [Arcobacter sp. F2176]
MSNVFRTGFIHITKEQAIEAFYNQENLFVSFNCSHIFTQVNFETKLLNMNLDTEFEQCFNLVKMKQVFPHKLNDTFFYIEEPKPVEVIDNHLSFNFSD